MLLRLREAQSTTTMHISSFSVPSWTSLIALILTCATLHASCTSAGAVHGRAVTNPTATIQSGCLTGTTSVMPSSTVVVYQFLGVPFAKPPIRFSTPEAPEPWASPLTVTAKPPACIQQFNDPPAARAFKERIYNYPPPPAGESEDCLYLNVYTPAIGKFQSKPKTVMMWFYGGNLQLGSNAIDMYDGTSFAANQDVVVVAANYRTNVFGFPNNPELPLDERNLGFLDQRLALQWVKDNICEFGGDPNKVTIFGQSAGAASVEILITSMSNEDNLPFRAGIMESGQAGLYVTHNNSNYAAWNALTVALSCDKAFDILDCVRSKNASEIKSILETQKLRFLPVADNNTMVEYPERKRRDGNIAKVPLMVGSNANEGRYFAYNVTDTLGWLRILTPAIPVAVWENIIAKYPIPSPGIANSFEQVSKIDTDYVFQCPIGQVANDSESVGIPTWRYYFDAVFPNNQPFPDLGAFHSAEIPIVFGTYNTSGATPEQIALSKLMQTAWANFPKDPWQGPGWSRTSNVHYFGSDGESDIPASQLDRKCGLYLPLYGN